MSKEFNSQLKDMHEMLDELVKERAEDRNIYDDINLFLTELRVKHTV